MNTLRPFNALGMPFHGLATNGTLADAGSGVKTVIDDFYAVGVAVPVIHPAAPGVSRNVAQAAIDTAKGYTWRDYALVCGDARAINGLPGTELGVNQWLYCDAGGATWVLELTATPASGTITFEVWLAGIFGRFGRVYSFTPRKLDDLVWSPDIPSWYTAGTYDAADVVAAIELDWVNTLAFSPDGASCFVNIFSDDISINSDVYPETTPQGSSIYYNRSTALVGVLEVALSGSGDLSASGAGVAGVLTEALAYEGGLVTNRSVGSGGAISRFPSWYVELLVDDPGCVGVGNGPATQTFTLSPRRALSGSEHLVGITYDAVLYKSPDGTLARAFDYSQVGTWDVTMVQPTMTRGFDVDCACTSSSGNAGGASVEVVITEQYSVSITAFGASPISTTWEIERTTVDVDDRFDSVGSTGYSQCPSGDPFPAATGLPAESDDTVATVNGDSTTGGSLYAVHEVRTLAQNLHYVATYTSQANNEATHDFIEKVVGLDETGSAAVLWTGTDTDTYRPASSAFPDLPVVRELVWAYQPISGDITHGSLNTTIAYTGDTYLYV